ncbi:MAG TPA: hypothetical protein VLR26_10205 [Frankiaceae bacterium]|nr:hypothetical protein [Frankiaceae bacterium]
MAKRKTGPLLAVAGVAVVGALAYGTVMSGGSSVKVADPGGGAVAATTPPPAPYAISTLGPIGTAAQDPGGGGGGTGAPGGLGVPGIQGAQGSGSPQGNVNSTNTLFFSGVNLLDPNQSATTSGDSTFPNPLRAVAGPLGPVLGGTSGSTVGCATTADSVGYYAIPLSIETVGFNGTPQVHIRISGGGPITVTLAQEDPNGNCPVIASGSGTISGGVANLTLGGPRHFQFSKGYIPALVIRAPSGSHTVSTSSGNPSYLRLPGMYGS